MSPENKQRVVGVVVLVAFIALLVPFLFTSGIKKRHKLEVDDLSTSTIATTQPSPSQVAAAVDTPADSLPGISGDQQLAASTEIKDGGNVNVASADLQQQTIPAPQSAVLSQEQLHQPTVASTDAQVLPETNAEVATPVQAEASSVTSTEVSPAVVPPSSAIVATPANTEVAVNAAPVPAAQIKSVVVAKDKKGKAIKANKNRKFSVVQKNKGKGKNRAVFNDASTLWSVQVGSFSDQGRMQKLVSNLRAKGFQVYMQKINTSKGEMVRVLVGNEANRAEAMKIAKKLKTSLKINGNVVGNKK